MRQFRLSRCFTVCGLTLALCTTGLPIAPHAGAASYGVNGAGAVTPGLDQQGGDVDANFEVPGDNTSNPGSETPTGGDGGNPDDCGLVTLAYGLTHGYTAGIGILDPEPDYSWYIDTCTNLLEAIPDPPAAVPTGPTQTDINGLMAQARARVEPPLLTIGTSPPLDPGAVVGISTWFWVDAGNWATQRSTASSTQWNLHVTVTAEPLQLRFNPGDQAAPGGGRTINCVGPALVWNRSLSDDDSDCTYTYDYPSSITPAGTFTVTAEVDWRLTYVVTGLINQSGTIGTITLASPSLNLPVAELQAVISN